MNTEDIQEIITKVPSWILRWGIMVFFGILLMIATISVFVRYPDLHMNYWSISAEYPSRYDKK